MTDDIRKVFNEIRFSEEGSSERVKEEAAYMKFIDYRGLREVSVFCIQQNLRITDLPN